MVYEFWPTSCFLKKRIILVIQFFFYSKFTTVYCLQWMHRGEVKGYIPPSPINPFICVVYITTTIDLNVLLVITPPPSLWEFVGTPRTVNYCIFLMGRWKTVLVWWAGESVIRNVRIGNPTKKRPRVRPRQRWLDRVKKDISDTDESKRLEDAIGRNGEMYREVWLKWAKDLYSINKKKCWKTALTVQNSAYYLKDLVGKTFILTALNQILCKSCKFYLYFIHTRWSFQKLTSFDFSCFYLLSFTYVLNSF